MTTRDKVNRLIACAGVVVTALYGSTAVRAGEGMCCGEYQQSNCHMDMDDTCDDGCTNSNFPDCCEGTEGLCQGG